MEQIITPEQWNQLITILISSIGGLATFIILIGRAIYKLVMTRIDNYAKTQESERGKIRDEYKLKFAALEDEAKTKDQLFELNKAHANSNEMVAHSVDKLTDIIGNRLADNTTQIEVFGGQLKNVSDSQIDLGMNMNEVVRVVSVASEKVDSLIARIGDFFNDLLERDEASTNSNTQHRQEILHAVRNMQKDMEILQSVQRELDLIKSKVSHLVDTQPLLKLDEALDAATGDNNSTQSIDEDKKDIA